MKKLLLLGGSRYLLPVIKEAKSLGCHTITCDYLPDNIAHKYSDEYHNVSIIDKAAVLALARELQIDGIMSFACDPGVTTAAYVAEKLGLPSCGSYESVSILQDKARFRSFLTEHGFNVPFFQGYSSVSAALTDAEDFNWPVIVKPVDSAGSKGISRVDSLSGLKSAIDLALSFSHCGRFIIEDFIAPLGLPSDTECFSVNGELCFVSFNCQYFDRSAENPYTPAGFSWPSSMTAAQQKELQAELQRLLRLLNMGTSVYNVETRVGLDGKPYIMEVSPRGGGNRLCEMLKYVTGADLIKNAVLAAIGETLEPFSAPVYDGCWAEVILHSAQAGRFSRLILSEEVLPFVVEQDLWVAPGDPVEGFTGANKTIGTLVLRFASPEERDLRMADIGSWLRIAVS